MLTAGEILQKQRLKKGLTLLDIEKKIKIRQKFLQAIEENNWNIFSSKIYIIGILKNYSRILGLDEKKILAVFRRDYERKEEVKFKERVAQKYLNPETKEFLKKGMILLFVFFFAYFGYQLYLYFSPPKIKILSPKTTVFKRENRVTVVGQVDKETMVVIANQRVYQNEKGIFEYDLPLKDGENKLIIELTGANGKKAKIEKIFIKEKIK